MTHHLFTPSRRVPVRRAAALLGATLVIVGTPLVARALGDDERPQTAPPVDVARAAANSATGAWLSPSEIDAGIDADPITAQSIMAQAIAVAVESSETESPERVSPAPAPTVDPVIVLLADTYEWDEQGLRVSVLQETLGLEADGVYRSATHRAHRNALEFVGLSLDTLPAPVLPPGPSEGEWEALRDCESNGNYAITNPSGKYRGAYQFDRRTWDSVADRHAPHLVGADPAGAAPVDQDFLALALYSERGARPWPHCGRHLS